MPTIMVPATPPAGSSYASLNDLAAFLYVDEASLSSDASRLLERASDVVDHYTLGRIDTDDTVHTEAAKKATCAQVEYWLNQGEDEDVKRQISGYTAGKTQVQFSDGKPSRLAPRARQALLGAGLLYCGASASRGGGIPQ